MMTLSVLRGKDHHIDDKPIPCFEACTSLDIVFSLRSLFRELLQNSVENSNMIVIWLCNTAAVGIGFQKSLLLGGLSSLKEVNNS